MKNSNKYEPIQSWEHLVDVATGAAAAHRATGHRRSEARQSGVAALPLPQYVDESTAHSGIADECLGLPPVAFRYAPTSRTRRLVITAATHRQEQAVSSLILAITGRRSGEGHTDGITTEDANPSYSPLEESDVREAIAVTVSTLPEVLRDAVTRLLLGASAPEGVLGVTWRSRVMRARQAFRAAWRECTEGETVARSEREPERSAWSPAPRLFCQMVRLHQEQAQAPAPRQEPEPERAPLTDEQRKQAFLALPILAQDRAIEARPELAKYLG